MSFNEDTTGVQRKPPPEGFSINLEHYSAAVEWLKSHVMRNHGLQVVKVVHDAYAGLWRCYDPEGEIVVNVEHELMQRLALVLEQVDWMWAAMTQYDEIDEEAQLKAIIDEHEDGA